MLNEVKHLRSLLQIGSKIGAETLRFAQGDKIFKTVRIFVIAAGVITWRRDEGIPPYIVDLQCVCERMAEA